jgi:hypothetical protein
MQRQFNAATIQSLDHRLRSASNLDARGRQGGEIILERLSGPDDLTVGKRLLA